MTLVFCSSRSCQVCCVFRCVCDVDVDVKSTMSEVMGQHFLWHYGFSYFYPKKKVILECILAALNVSEEDQETQTHFFI